MSGWLVVEEAYGGMRVDLTTARSRFWVPSALLALDLVALVCAQGTPLAIAALVVTLSLAVLLALWIVRDRTLRVEAVVSPGTFAFETTAFGRLHRRRFHDGEFRLEVRFRRPAEGKPPKFELYYHRRFETQSLVSTDDVVWSSPAAARKALRELGELLASGSGFPLVVSETWLQEEARDVPTGSVA